MGTLKVSELGIGEGHMVLKFRVGEQEVVQFLQGRGKRLVC